ncbi:MAG: hypothetical protein ACKPBU_01320 [Alphaproteobacteria bacterium]
MKISVWRLEVDHIDEPVAEIRWFETEAEANAEADAATADTEYSEVYGRRIVETTVMRLDVEPTPGGLLAMLNGWCGDASPAV